MSEIEKKTCPECGKEFSNNFDKYSIEASGRCVDDQKKWEDKPENDLANKKFIVTYTYTETGDDVIFAKDEDAARKQFEEENGDEYQVESVSEV